MNDGLSGARATPAIRQKWRPSLAMVIGMVLAVVLTLPLAGMAAVVALSRTPEVLIDSLADNLGRIVMAGLVVVVATALVGFLFWRLVTRPVHDLVGWTDAVAARAAAPMPSDAHYGTRELARLAASFAKMVERLRERSDYISTFTAHVSHELKSPLSAIAGAAELMRDAGDGMDAAMRGRFLQNIETDALRLSDLVARMRDLARAENADSKGVSHLPDIAKALRERFPSLAIAVADDVPSLPIPPDDAVAVLSNLADNALAHGAGTLRIRRVAGDHGAAILVSNDGDPISAGNRDRVFEPFYTTRRESGGTGMGLVIVKAMLKAHGGDIALDDEQTEVAFRIGFPAS